MEISTKHGQIKFMALASGYARAEFKALDIRGVACHGSVMLGTYNGKIGLCRENEANPKSTWHAVRAYRAPGLSDATEAAKRKIGEIVVEAAAAWSSAEPNAIHEATLAAARAEILSAEDAVRSAEEALEKAQAALKTARARVGGLESAAKRRAKV